MTKKNWIKVSIVIAIVLAGITMVKLMPLSWTISAVTGFVGGVACCYLWNKKLQE